MILVDVWQKPTQYCKAIILLLKINTLKKKKQAERVDGLLLTALNRQIARHELVIWPLDPGPLQLNAPKQVL